MKNPMKLKNKDILITGGSSGIGKETAILLSELGANVSILARSTDKLKDTIEELSGENHKYYSFDLENLDEINKLIRNIINDSNKLDGFVHCAGISDTRPLKMLKPKSLNKVMLVNYYSFIELVRCIVKNNKHKNKFNVVGVSSIASKQGNKGKTAYCASKAAMDASVRCLAKELANKNIRVNSVMPALINTEIYDEFLDRGGDSKDTQNIIDRQYLGIGEPIDVANVIAFLLSDASKFITGSSVSIDGGRLTS